jgi:AcrR family transcriptional regulator
MTASRAEIGRRRRAQTRAALVKAAMTVFARLGPDAPTIEDFIAEAGVARGTFYNYFETREDVLVAVAGQLGDQLLAEVEALRSLPDPADRVGCSVRTFIKLAASDSTSGWVIVRVALIAAPLGARMRDYLTRDVSDGMVSGRFEPPSAQAAADLILGAGLMGMRSVLQGEAGEAHAEHIARMVLFALGVRDAAEVAQRSMESSAIAARSGSVPPQRTPGRKRSRGSGVDPN